MIQRAPLHTVAADLVACAALLLLACGPPASPASVLLVTLDTTRPDHLGVYGYSQPTTPNLDALARQSAVYENVFSTTNWTLAAHASLFTGKFPLSHGARYDPGGSLALGDAIRGAEHYADYSANPLGSDHKTLASILGERGYATAGFVAGPWMKRMFGLDQGFQRYDDSGIEQLRGRLASDVSDAALEWLDEHGDGPFFLFLNYYDPHVPYNDPEGHYRRFQAAGSNPREATIEALYDGEIFYSDRQLGRVFARLSELGRFDDTLIVVTADHGELLGEHNSVGHGSSMFEQELRIPLIVKPAGAPRAGTRHAERLQLLDVMPMILTQLGIAPDEDVQGGLPPEIGHPIYAEAALPAHDSDFQWRVLYAGPLKLHWNAKGYHRLFDLEVDPEEHNDLAKRRLLLAQMIKQLAAYRSTLPVTASPTAKAPLDAETRQLLESLGYLERDEAAADPKDEAEP